MVNNQKGFANIILVIVVVILVGAAGYFGFVKKSGPIAQQPTPTPTQTKPLVSPTPTSDQTTNWKTYTNSQYGFEFKYPEDAKVKEEKFTSCREGFKECLRVFLTFSDNQTVEYQFGTIQVGRDFINGSKIKKEKIIIDNKEYQLWSDNQFVNIFSNGDFLVSAYNDTGTINITFLKQILSTFKFTK